MIRKMVGQCLFMVNINSLSICILEAWIALDEVAMIALKILFIKLFEFMHFNLYGFVHIGIIILVKQNLADYLQFAMFISRQISVDTNDKCRLKDFPLFRQWDYLIKQPLWNLTFPTRHPRVFEWTVDGSWKRCLFAPQDSWNEDGGSNFFSDDLDLPDE